MQGQLEAPKNNRLSNFNNRFQHQVRRHGATSTSHLAEPSPHGHAHRPPRELSYGAFASMLPHTPTGIGRGTYEMVGSEEGLKGNKALIKQRKSKGAGYAMFCATDVGKICC